LDTNATSHKAASTNRDAPTKFASCAGAMLRRVRRRAVIWGLHIADAWREATGLGSEPFRQVSLKVPTPELVTRPAANAQELIVTRLFPMTIRRRGVEMRLLIEGNRVHAPRGDSALLKAVARAQQWSEDLLMGRAQSVVEIAEREGVTDRYVRRLTRLAFLAPEIVEAIVAGNQPPELTAEALTERIDLPLVWTAQEQAVGIA
jgi:hypothetical protein